MYRLLRLFSKVRAHSRRCSSFPTATRRASVSDIAATRWSLTDVACPLRVLCWARSWRAALRAAFTLGLYLFRQRMAKRKTHLSVCLSFWVFAAEGVLHPFDFKCSGEINSPCAKVFAAGENACTARTRRPAVRGPNQCPHLFLQCTAHRSKRYALAPVFQKAMHAHILPLLPSAMQLVTSSRSSAAHSGSALDRSGKTSYNTKAIRV